MKKSPLSSLRAQTIATCLSLLLGTVFLTGILVLAGEIRRGNEQLHYDLNLTADKKTLELNTCFVSVENAVLASQDYILRTIDEERILRDGQYEKNYMEGLTKEMTALAGLANGVMTFYFRMNVERFGGTRGIFLEGSPASGYIGVKPTNLLDYSPTDSEHVGWYYEPVWAKRPIWTAPYENKNIGVQMISYVAPIYRSGRLLGVVGMDIKLASIKNIVDTLPIQDELCLLIGQSGGVVYYNNASFSGSSVEQSMEVDGITDRFSGLEREVIRTFHWTALQHWGVMRELENGMSLVLGVSARAMNAAFFRIVTPLGLALLISLLFTALLLFLALKRIISPIRTITEATHRLSRGELGISIPYSSSNELGQLADNIRMMTSQMQEYISHIREQAKKERLSRKAAEAQSKSQSEFLSAMYLSMHEVDLEADTFRQIQSRSANGQAEPETVEKASEILPLVMRKLASADSIDTLLSFMDFATLDERMGKRITIAQEFLTSGGIWCRGRFIAMDRGKDGTLHRVLWAVENIHEERAEREKLQAEAERVKAESLAKSQFLASMYLSLHEIDLNEDVFSEITSRTDIAESVGTVFNQARATVHHVMEERVANQGQERKDFFEFINFDTLDERMKNKITIAQEFLTVHDIWCRARFIVMDRNEDGSLHHVLWAIENINEERIRREALHAEAERVKAESLAKSQFLASMYLSLHEIDLNEDVFSEITSRRDIAEEIGSSFTNARATVRRVMEERVANQGQTRKDFMDFINFDTLDERMKDKITIAQEFYSVMGYWCRARFILMDRNEDGSLHHVLWAVENIAAERAERERLEGEVAKSVAASQAKSAFLANMSHEIRTPINAVLGMDEMILRECQDKDILGYAANIKTAGTSLLAIINDILDFSKIEAGKMELLPENYDISSVVVDLVNMINERARKKGLDFVLQTEPTLPKTLYGDSVRIKQCILNLLTNAVKYTKAGTVTFTVGYHKIDQHFIALHVAVEDTGSGIKQEDMDKLFSPFERIDEGKNKTIEGTGLGMSIVMKMLAMMDSKLEVQSEYGKGSLFSFVVKQQVIDWTEVGDINEAYQKSLSQMTEYREKLHAPKARLLFVDDTEMNLEVVKGLLKKTGITLDTCLSGKEALEKVQEHVYDILFIDHRMPEMDGIQTLHAMAVLHGNKSAGKPCIALTANAIAGVKQMYLDEGFTDYLSKPVNPDKLEAMIRKYLPPDYIEDYLEPADEDEGEEGGSSGFVAAYRALEGVDADAALASCGTEEVLSLSVAKYAATIDEKAAELQALFDAGDWENYGTKVHSLKSTSRLIGALELSRQAEHLEHSADAGDSAEIQAKHGALMELFVSYKEKLAPVTAPAAGEGSADGAAAGGSEKAVISEAELGEKLAKLGALAEDFDIDGLDAVMAELSAAALPESFAETFKKIRTSVENVDFKELKALLSQAGFSA